MTPFRRSWRRFGVGVWFVACILSVADISHVRAQQIDESCIASYDVKDKVFSMHEMSMSCTSIESIRQGLLQSLQHLEGTRGPALDEQVLDLEATRAKVHSDRMREWGRIIRVFVGNFATTVGLSACSGGPNPGCLIAAIRAIVAKYGVVKGTIDFAPAYKALSALEAELDVVEKKLNEQVMDLDAARKLMISDFNSFCSMIRAQCL